MDIRENYISRSLHTSNKLGLHVWAAVQFVQVANKFRADIFVEKEGQEVSGKYYGYWVMLAAACGLRFS